MNAADETVLEKWTLIEDALTLSEFLSVMDGFDDLDLATVYIEDEHGNMFGGVKFVERTLTDGSKIFNLVLTVSA